MVLDDLRIAVVFRDIEIPAGKAEVQFGHAIALIMYEAPKDLVARYMETGQKKLSLQGGDAASLMKLIAAAAARGIPTAKVVDAGNTVFEGPTLTAVALGPMTKTDSNALTRGLKMR